MRLFEILHPSSQVLVSGVFRDRFNEEVKNKPSLYDRLKFFLNAKLNNISPEDDLPFTGNEKLKAGRYRKWPLETGKLIVIYKIDGSNLKLCDIVIHKAYDSAHAANRLAARMNKLSDFTRLDPEKLFDEQDDEEEPLLENLRKILDNIIYELISADAFDVLKPAIEKDEWNDLMDWFHLELGSTEDEKFKNVISKEIFSAYGGEDDFKKFILKSIKEFGKIEEYNNLILD